MTHVMMDLETLGTRPGSVLRSVGAVVFDPHGSGTGAEFYANIDRESCREIGLTEDQSTIEWWERQPQDARDALEVDPRPLSHVISDFNHWFIEHLGEFVWAQGAPFDPVLWEAAVSAAHGLVPWKFWNIRDTRTVYHMNDLNVFRVRREGVYHGALDDAKHQAKLVQMAHRSWRP